MSNRRNIQFMYSPHNKATVLDCSFVVDSTNASGLGIRSLKGSSRIGSVFMNTSAGFTGTLNSTVNVTGIATGTGSLQVGMPIQGTYIPAGTTIASIVSGTAITLSAAATGSATEALTYQAVGNVPNPGAGLIQVMLQDNYARYLSGYSGFISPLSGSTITSGLTVGAAYVIVSLGSSTVAQWQAAGLELTITPAVGASFLATATSIAGGGAVQAVATNGAGIDHIEVIGDPNQMNNSSSSVLGSGGGMLFILGCYKNGTLTAPANGTVIGMNFYMNDSYSGV